LPEGRLRELLEAAAGDGTFSGAVLRVEDLRGPGALVEHVVGTVSADPPGPPVRPDTLFDLASLTKLYTATAVLRLVARGELTLDPSLRDLLEHRSGLPAWAPLYDGATPRAAARAIQPGPRGRHVYSDIGFLQLLDRLPGPVDEVIAREVLEPLQLSATGFRGVGQPPAAAAVLLAGGDVAATERCPRRGLLVGEVSDGNTWALGGVSGHAGLFATAADVGRFARGWWTAPETGFLPLALRDEAWGDPPEPGTHVLGWDTAALEGSSLGSRLSRRSHGHLAFTGCSLWVDPDRAVAVIFLNNRIHPHRDDRRIRALRPLVHDAVADVVDLARARG
jgi:CubicO group peptidase (beta-lactamase class C family)